MKNFIFLVIFLSHTLCIAQWRLDKKTDAMTDEIKKTAIISNEAGHTFSIYRLKDLGPVWGNFSISQKSSDQVDWEKAPIYRVDKNEPFDLNVLKRTDDLKLGLPKMYFWEPKWVNFQIWHGEKNEGVSRNLKDIANGSIITFRYYLATGGYKETSFKLKGSGPVISNAIDYKLN